MLKRMQWLPSPLQPRILSRSKQKANQTAIYGNGYWQAVQPYCCLVVLKAAGKRKDEPEAAPVSRKDEEKAVQKNVAASAAAVAATKVTPSEKTQDGLFIEDDVVINEVEESSNNR